MEQNSLNIRNSKSEIPYNYATIQITQSRIDKGLIAIPIGLSQWFPDTNQAIEIYLNDSPISQSKRYTSYNSSARECRIGGVKEWFQQNNIRSGDEIVIQCIDREEYIYRLIPERNFISNVRELQKDLDSSEDEQKAKEKIIALADWTHLENRMVAINEYRRLLTDISFEDRKYTTRSSGRTRETVPINIKTILGNIYAGHCQVCDFWFLKKDKNPYYEIHHLKPSKGHHPKNLILVCGNCHNQFEYSNVKYQFNEESWLIHISFNERLFKVKQALLDEKNLVFSKELFV